MIVMKLDAKEGMENPSLLNLAKIKEISCWKKTITITEQLLIDCSLMEVLSQLQIPSIMFSLTERKNKLVEYSTNKLSHTQPKRLCSSAEASEDIRILRILQSKTNKKATDTMNSNTGIVNTTNIKNSLLLKGTTVWEKKKMKSTMKIPTLKSDSKHKATCRQQQMLHLNNLSQETKKSRLPSNPFSQAVAMNRH
jgi:hypothetical protein